jgi:hypothetical protein
VRILILFLLSIACGGSTRETEAPPAAKSGQTGTAAAQAAPDGQSGAPPRPADRNALCERAMDRAIEILRRETTSLQDDNEIKQTRDSGIRDCMSSQATTDDLECVIRAQTLDDLTRCDKP